jgi:hypothetical protein
VVKSTEFGNRDVMNQLAEEWDKENKREGLELINVSELTGKVLKVCNVIRDKSL